MITAIVNVDENWGIGNNNELLIRIPEDMKRFKEITTSANTNSLIVGRKTYESLPKKMLANLSDTNRHCVVVTNSINSPRFYEDGTVRTDMKSLVEWLNAKDCLYPKHDFYVIGGGKIYKELLPLCDLVYVTKVFHKFDNVDTYFPNLDEMHQWYITSNNEAKEYNGIWYQFYTYEQTRSDKHE